MLDNTSSIERGAATLDALPPVSPVSVVSELRQGRGRAAADTPAALLSDVYDFIGRFVAYPSEHARVAHALWIMHAHLMEAWESTPRLAFLSPEPGSGKTRALEITGTLVPRPVESVNATPAYLFRKVSDKDGLPCILFDEIDTLFGPRAKENEEVRGMLNAGHRRGAKAGRCVIHGKTVTTEELPAYCAVALAGLGDLPDTILSRSIVIRMRRRGPTERVEPYRHREHEKKGHAIRNRIAEWAQTVVGEMEDARPNMPPEIEDRNADVWESLLAIADVAGGEWLKRARDSAVSFVSLARDLPPSLGVRLLADLRGVFGKQDELSTVKILSSLIALDESPWGALNGMPLDSRGLANLLRPYGVRSHQIRLDTKTTLKGYRAKDLHDPWSRYPGPPSAKSETCETSETGESRTQEAADAEVLF